MTDSVEVARVATLQERGRCVDMLKARMFLDPSNRIQREINAALLAVWGDIESGTGKSTTGAEHGENKTGTSDTP